MCRSEVGLGAKRPIVFTQLRLARSDGGIALVAIANGPKAQSRFQRTARFDFVAQKKSERLMNLTIMLLSANKYVSRDEIRARIEGYRDLNDSNFERTFERDKDELRARGVPIETGSNSALFSDETGYMIKRSDYELPEVQFSKDETALLSLASSVWQQASTSDQARKALLKLRAGGVEIESDREDGVLETRVSVEDPSFEPIWEALAEKRVVSFEYRNSPATRIVQPWRLVMRSNIWYLLGYDVTKESSRIFRLNRITSNVKVGEVADYEIPDSQTLNDMAASIAPSGDNGEAVLAIRKSHAPALRRRGERIEWRGELPEGFQVWRVRLPYNPVAEIASFGSQVLVLEPDQLKNQVIERLKQVVGAHGGEHEE